MEMPVQNQQNSLDQRIEKLKANLSGVIAKGDISLLQKVKQVDPSDIGGIDWDSTWDNWSKSK